MKAMEDDKLSSVLTKIENLKALAGSTSHAAERETALATVARMQATYRLDAAEVQAKTRQIDIIDVNTPVYLYQTGKKSYWRDNLARFVATLSGVFLDVEEKPDGINGRKVSKYRIYGTHGNVEMAVRLFNYLLAVIPELAAQVIPPRQGKGINPAKEAYCNGCVQGFAVKMQSERDSIIRSGSSTAIAILDSQAALAEAAFRRKMDGVFAKNSFKSRATRVYSAEGAGFAKGEDLAVKVETSSLPPQSQTPNQLYR